MLKWNNRNVFFLMFIFTLFLLLTNTMVFAASRNSDKEIFISAIDAIHLAIKSNAEKKIELPKKASIQLKNKSDYTSLYDEKYSYSNESNGKLLLDLDKNEYYIEMDGIRLLLNEKENKIYLKNAEEKEIFCAELSDDVKNVLVKLVDGYTQKGTRRIYYLMEKIMEACKNNLDDKYFSSVKNKNGLTEYKLSFDNISLSQFTYNVINDLSNDGEFIKLMLEYMNMNSYFSTYTEEKIKEELSGLADSIMTALNNSKELKFELSLFASTASIKNISSIKLLYKMDDSHFELKIDLKENYIKMECNEFALEVIPRDNRNFKQTGDVLLSLKTKQSLINLNDEEKNNTTEQMIEIEIMSSDKETFKKSKEIMIIFKNNGETLEQKIRIFTLDNKILSTSKSIGIECIRGDAIVLEMGILSGNKKAVMQSSDIKMMIKMNGEEHEVLHIQAKDGKSFEKSGWLEITIGYEENEKLYLMMRSKDGKALKEAKKFKINMDYQSSNSHTIFNIDEKNIEYEEIYDGFSYHSVEKVIIQELKSLNMNQYMNKKNAKEIPLEELLSKMRKENNLLF